MLWISVYLPELSLQSHARGAIGLLQSVPLVISDGVASRPHVHEANAFARKNSITPRMPIAAAQARVPQLLVVPREPQKELETLQLIANWLTQFSPMVCGETAGASLEISSTLRLFGGFAQLAARIRHGIAGLGLHACAGIAPTPLAAWLLAKASHQMTGLRMCRESADLPERLGDIPLILFDWPHEILQPLSDLGLVRIKDLLVQPRAGLRRRFGDRVLHDLDRALGKSADPREPHRVPETFSGNTDLLFDIVDAERLLIPVRMLLNGMEGFMRARDAARSAADWMRLIRERLTAHPFPEAVVALKLSAVQLLPYQEQNECWLPEQDMHCEKWQAMIERVASRLGEKSVFAVGENSDHRPEMAWRENAGRPGDKLKKTPGRKSERPRPLLLLREPVALVTVEGSPQHHGPLALLAGPERIDTGWWDGHLVARDYYVAKNPEQEICWIFHDYRIGKKWYLHGYFS